MSSRNLSEFYFKLLGETFIDDNDNTFMKHYKVYDYIYGNLRPTMGYYNNWRTFDKTWEIHQKNFLKRFGIVVPETFEKTIQRKFYK